MKKNYRIVLLSQSLHADDANANDLLFVEPFLKHSTISATRSIQETLSMYAHLDFVIGMRLHSLILAVDHTIPFLALSYETKTRELLKDLEYDYFLDCSTFEITAFENQFNSLENEAQKVKFALQQKNDTIKADLQKQIDQLLQQCISTL